jgi:hypothetical protein
MPFDTTDLRQPTVTVLPPTPPNPPLPAGGSGFVVDACFLCYSLLLLLA